MEDNNQNAVHAPENKNRNPYAQTAPETKPDTPNGDGASAPAAPVKPAVQRQRFETTRADVIFAGAEAAFTLFGVIAGLWGGARLGFALAFLLNFAAVSIYLGRKKSRPDAYGAMCGALAVLLTPGFVLTSNGIVRFFSGVGAAVLSVLWFASLAGRRIPAGDLGLVSAAGTPLTDAPGSLALTLRGYFTGSERTKRTAKVLLGLLCAVPVLCAVIPLLVSSDAAFEGLLKNAFGNLGTIALQLAVTVLLLPLILSFALALAKKDKQPAAIRELRGVDTVFTVSFFTAISIAYLAYLGSQLAYFFDAFKGLLPEGYSFSYAEYARRGFFELCAVAAINLALLFAAILFARKKEGKLPAAVKAPGTFIALFTLLLIGTALAKMALYIKNYGMTVLRLGVSAFSVFMAVVFIAVLLRLYTAKVKVLQIAAAAAAAVLIVLGAGNVNGFVAKYNYEAYTAGKLTQLDVAYLAGLGPESVPYLVKTAENEKEQAKVRREAARALYGKATALYESEFDDELWQIYLIHSDDSYDYTDAFGPVDAKPLTPLKRTAAGFAQWSLPQRSAYNALEAFLAAHPDFIKTEPVLHNRSGGERGYFDAEEPTTAAPAPEEQTTAGEPATTEEPSR